MTKLPDILFFNRGDRIIEEGDPAICAYIIVSGEVEVLKRNKLGKDVHVGRLGANEIVGEICLFMDDTVRLASVVASTEKVQVILLKKAEWEEEIRSLSPRMQVIMQAMTQRLRQIYTKVASLS